MNRSATRIERALLVLGVIFLHGLAAVDGGRLLVAGVGLAAVRATPRPHPQAHRPAHVAGVRNLDPHLPRCRPSHRIAPRRCSCRHPSSGYVLRTPGPLHSRQLRGSRALSVAAGTASMALPWFISVQGLTVLFRHFRIVRRALVRRRTPGGSLCSRRSRRLCRLALVPLLTTTCHTTAPRHIHDFPSFHHLHHGSLFIERLSIFAVARSCRPRAGIYAEVTQESSVLSTACSIDPPPCRDFGSRTRCVQCVGILGVSMSMGLPFSFASVSHGIQPGVHPQQDQSSLAKGYRWGKPHPTNATSLWNKRNSISRGDAGTLGVQMYRLHGFSLCREVRLVPANGRAGQRSSAVDSQSASVGRAPPYGSRRVSCSPVS